MFAFWLTDNYVSSHSPPVATCIHVESNVNHLLYFPRIFINAWFTLTKFVNEIYFVPQRWGPKVGTVLNTRIHELFKHFSLKNGLKWTKSEWKMNVKRCFFTQSHPEIGWYANERPWDLACNWEIPRPSRSWQRWHTYRRTRILV